MMSQMTMSEYLNRCTNTSKFSRTKRTVSRPMCFHLQAHHKCSAQNKTMDTSMMHLNIHSFFKGFFQIHVVFHLDCKKQKKTSKTRRSGRVGTRRRKRRRLLIGDGHSQRSHQSRQLFGLQRGSAASKAGKELEGLQR